MPDGWGIQQACNSYQSLRDNNEIVFEITHQTIGQVTARDWIYEYMAKGNRRRSIEYCPHLWKSPLQPFQPAQQSPWLWENSLQPVVAVTGGFHRCGQCPMVLLRLPLGQLMPVHGSNQCTYCCMPGCLGCLNSWSRQLARVAFPQNRYRDGSSGLCINTLWGVIFVYSWLAGLLKIGV